MEEKEKTYSVRLDKDTMMMVRDKAKLLGMKQSQCIKLALIATESDVGKKK